MGNVPFTIEEENLICIPAIYLSKKLVVIW